MSRPSDPLLTWLRGVIEARGTNVAALSKKAGLQRARVRRVVSGAEPMLVDELLALSKALELSMRDMGMPDDGSVPPEPEPSPVLSIAPAPTKGPVVDAWGNQPEQLVRIAFQMGCDFMILSRAADLDGSGVPEHVLAQHKGRDLLVKLDAAYHEYNKPRYSPNGVTLTLSFDRLYDCTFPWPSIRQVMFFPAEPPAAESFDPAAARDPAGAGVGPVAAGAGASPPPDKPEPPKKGPHLRLVT